MNLDHTLPHLVRLKVVVAISKTAVPSTVFPAHRASDPPPPYGVEDQTSPQRGLVLWPVEPVADEPLLHLWLIHPKIRFWDIPNTTVVTFGRRYQRMPSDPSGEAFAATCHHTPYHHTPRFLTERYAPAHNELASPSRAAEGAVGRRVSTAPTARSSRDSTTSR